MSTTDPENVSIVGTLNLLPSLRTLIFYPFLPEKDDCATGPSDKFWSLYVKQTAVMDRDLVEEWIETTNGILIFVRVLGLILGNLSDQAL